MSLVTRNSGCHCVNRRNQSFVNRDSGSAYNIMAYQCYGNMAEHETKQRLERMIAIEQVRRDPETVRRAMQSRGEPDPGGRTAGTRRRLAPRQDAG